MQEISSKILPLVDAYFDAHSGLHGSSVERSTVLQYVTTIFSNSGTTEAQDPHADGLQRPPAIVRLAR